MNSIDIKRILFLAVIFVFSFKVKGQQGDTTVTIIGHYAPTLEDAKKMEIRPVLVDTVYAKPNFNYSIIEHKFETPFKVTPIRPAKLVGESLNKLYANYVSAAMGNKLTPFFEFYHSKLRSRNISYGMHLKHFSSAGEIKDYAYPAWSNNIVEAYMSRYFKKTILDINMGYKRDVTHFYGFHPTDYPDSLLPTDVENAQRYSLASIDARWYRYRLRKTEMNYDIKFKYYYLQDFYKTAENNIALKSFVDWNTDLIKEFKNERIGVALDEKFFYNMWDSIDAVSTNMLTIAPYYKFFVSGLDVKFGVDFQVKTDSISEMFIYPRLELKLAAIPDVLYFNAALKGGHYRNSLKSFSNENPFISSNIPLAFTNRKYQINFGVGSSISKTLNLNLQLYFDQFKNAALFVSDTSVLHGNKFTAIYEDYDRLKLQMEVAYQKKENFKVLLRGNYYVYNMTNELFAWHKPDYDVTLSANYNIQDKILFKAEIFGCGSSMVPVWTDGVLSPQTLKAWVDVNMGVEYRYRKKMSFFLNLNNITASRYYRWYDYPTYKFNFMAGLSYIF